MKIAFIVSAFPTTSETFILDQVTGLIDRNVDVDIYAVHPDPGTKTHPEYNRYNLADRIYYQNKLFKYFPSLFFPNPPGRSASITNTISLTRYRFQIIGLKVFYTFLPFLKKSYDIIHAHFGPHGVRALLLKDIQYSDAKLVTSFHGYDMSLHVKKHGTNVYHRLFKDGDLFLPVSYFWKTKLIEWGCQDSKIIVHNMGINADKIDFSDRPAENHQSKNLLSIARLTEKKGLLYSIKAVSRLLKQNVKLSYTIIGDGELKNDLNRLITELGVQNQIQLVGWKNRYEVLEYIKMTDILIAPSVMAQNGDMEGIPMVIMEAMAAGIPVISTFHSGIPELIKDNETGFLIPEKNPEMLAKKIMFIINNQGHIKTVIQNARKYIETHFNIKIQNDKLLQIYKNLL